MILNKFMISLSSKKHWPVRYVMCSLRQTHDCIPLDADFQPIWERFHIQEVFFMLPEYYILPVRFICPSFMALFIS
jgi:hypothetical protein